MNNYEITSSKTNDLTEIGPMAKPGPGGLVIYEIIKIAKITQLPQNHMASSHHTCNPYTIRCNVKLFHELYSVSFDAFVADEWLNFDYRPGEEFGSPPLMP